MKTPLILLAAITLGGAAVAQNQPAMPPAGMTAPGDAAPPSATPPMAPSMPSAADPTPAATPTPPMASAAPMASDTPAQPAQQPMAAMAMASSGGDGASYPACSRRMQDKCRNRGGR